MEKRRGPITLLMTSRRFRRWVVVVLLPMLYVGSFGPACWLCHARLLPLTPVGYFYWPLVYRAWHVGFGTDALHAYATYWNPGSDVIGDLIAAVARS